MVGNGTVPTRCLSDSMPTSRGEIDTEGLEARIAALPGFERARDAANASGAEAYLVGGAVRDALLGAGRADLDLVVAGDPGPLVEALGEAARTHDRFGTATVLTPEGPIDVATARTESYAYPGALPDVRPAGIGEDLARRDFTINALAVPIAGEFELIDPTEGVADLRAGFLRLLHAGSIADDPTRALRAARYAARLGLEPEPHSLELIEAADFSTVSGDRVDAELAKLANEDEPRRGLELLDEWGLIELAPGAGARLDAVVDLLRSPRWRGEASRAEAVRTALVGPSAPVDRLLRAAPASPSAAVDLAIAAAPVELILARALGAEWLDRYVDEWRDVQLEISGEDLLAAGVPQGPAVGRGLAEALRAKLDGEAEDREDELRIALAAAGERRSLN